MTDHADFMRTIIANRDDDEPRRVYANWLEEHTRPARPKCPNGNKFTKQHMWSNDGPICLACGLNSYAELAEFIRVQIELERLPFDLSGWKLRPRQTVAELHREFGCYCTVCARYQLLCQHALGIFAPKGHRLNGHREWFPWFDDSWLIRLGDDTRGYSSKVARVSRGFVDDVQMTLSDWLRDHPWILTATPLRKVRLLDGLGNLTLEFVEINDRVARAAYRHVDGRIYLGVSEFAQSPTDAVMEASLKAIGGPWPDLTFEFATHPAPNEVPIAEIPTHG